MTYKIAGLVSDKSGTPLSGATVMLKNAHFENIVTTAADENGHYLIDVDEGVYPYMLAVRDYAEAFLEHWVGNISLHEDVEINFTVDTLEVYGLTCFKIRGGAPALSVYFRPMSLEKFKAGMSDICPDIDIDSVAVSVNGENVSIGTLSEVMEFYPSSHDEESQRIKGYFLMTALPKSELKNRYNFLEIKIEDKTTRAIGCAGVFFDK